MYHKIIDSRIVPTEWKRSITIPIIKKGDKKAPENYRGVALLNTTMKLFTGILADIIEEKISISAE